MSLTHAWQGCFEVHVSPMVPGRLQWLTLSNGLRPAPPGNAFHISSAVSSALHLECSHDAPSKPLAVCTA